MPPKRKRLTKKEIKHDPILESVLTAWQYYTRHSARFNGIALGVVVLVVALIGLNSYHSSGIRDAETDLARALFHYEAGEQKQSVEFLGRLVSEKGGTPAGKRAVYYLGQAKFQMGEYADAQALFSQYESHATDDPMLKAAAAKGEADCLVELGELSAAGVKYLEVAKEFNANPLAPDCLFLAGLALGKAADKKSAVSALRKLLEDYPDYVRSGQARVLLGELRAENKRVGSLSSPIGADS